MSSVRRDDFAALVTRAMREPGRHHMRPVVEKELLHYDILFALDRAHLLDTLTFQGGTALRLIHGGSRFSEDLDFVGGRALNASDLVNIKDCIQEYVGARYGLAVNIREPRTLHDERTAAGVSVQKWQVSVETAPERPDLPRQRIKLELVNVPAYTASPEPLQLNYDFLPDGYDELLVMTESLDEILADKLVAFVKSHYIRHRDIWDINWLLQPTRGAVIDGTLLARKLSDYGITDYPAAARTRREQVPTIVQGSDFHETLKRFLPADVQQRTLERPKFMHYLTRGMQQALDRAIAVIEAPEGEDSGFSM